MTALQRYFPQLCAGAAILLLGAALSAGFWMTGGPDYQHRLRVDEKQMQYISRLHSRVETYVRQHKVLPPSLAALSEEAPSDRIDDTEAPKGLTYRVMGEGSFSICGRFDMDTRQLSTREAYWRGAGLVHPAGFTCFSWSRVAAANPASVYFKRDP